MIFLFKYPTGEQRRPTETGPADGTFDFDAAEHMFFAAQTIQNACGTQALLSVLLNKTGEIDIGPQLGEFKEFTAAFPAEVCRTPPRCQTVPVLPPFMPSHAYKYTSDVNSYAARPSPTPN